MAIYEYECSVCGRFDVRLAMGTAPERRRCPGCERPARRAFSPPNLTGSSHTPLRGLRATEERSQDLPQLTSQVPPQARSVVPDHPALARLPRP